MLFFSTILEITDEVTPIALLTSSSTGTKPVPASRTKSKGSTGTAITTCVTQR